LLAANKVKDYAVLKVKAADLPTLPLGDSDTLRQGDKVYTLSSPFGFELTASEGMISAFRSASGEGVYLQTTAPVSEGSSGGPLLDAQGEVIGVIEFKFKKGQALNFALAINEVKGALGAGGPLHALPAAIPPPLASHPHGTVHLSRPSVVEIGREMSRTVEVTYPHTHFKAFLKPLTISDGQGGSLTAVVGVRYPTADAYGQLIFFWHNTRFLGWDARWESDYVAVTSPRAGTFIATYPHYKETDPMSSPSLPNVRVVYRWNGKRLIAQGSPPLNGTPVMVKLLYRHSRHANVRALSAPACYEAGIRHLQPGTSRIELILLPFLQ
jgi:hypothetical protein